MDESKLNSTDAVNLLVCAVRNKLLEQIERTQNLLSLIPSDKPDWQPTVDSFRVSDLLGHLLECAAGFCALLYALRPVELSHFKNLRELSVNHSCSIGEACERLREYETYINEGFAILRDVDLARRIPTVFVQEGETALTLLLGNLEHLINHKHQLFFYLKLLAVEVTSSDLYRFRGE